MFFFRGREILRYRAYFAKKIIVLFSQGIQYGLPVGPSLLQQKLIKKIHSGKMEIETTKMPVGHPTFCFCRDCLTKLDAPKNDSSR
jgi:hypothetical protein